MSSSQSPCQQLAKLYQSITSGKLLNPVKPWSQLHQGQQGAPPQKLNSLYPTQAGSPHGCQLLKPGDPPSLVHATVCYPRLYVSPSPFSWASPPSCLFLRFAKRPNWPFLLLICLFLSLSCPLHPWFCPCLVSPAPNRLSPCCRSGANCPCRLPSRLGGHVFELLIAANKTWIDVGWCYPFVFFAAYLQVLCRVPALAACCIDCHQTPGQNIGQLRSNDRVTANSLQSRLLTSRWGFKHSWKYVSNLGR